MNTPQNFVAAIFDLDGVLVDTAEFHYLAWKRLSDEIGVPFDRPKNERMRGVPRAESLEIILEGIQERPWNLQELADRKNGYYVAMIRQLSPADALPGVPGFLAGLRERGVKIGIGSSSKNAQAVLRSLGISALLDAVVDGNGFTHAKPDPEIFVNCARLLAVPAAECVVVEDAQAGIDAAKAAGMYAVGVCPTHELVGADLLVRQAADIPLTLWQPRPTR